MIDKDRVMGFSVFALHQLQPSPRHWNLAKLRDFTDSQTVNILDPYLAGIICDHINGCCDKITGFNITDDMRSSRQAKLGQKGFPPTPPQKLSAMNIDSPRLPKKPCHSPQSKSSTS